MEQPVDTSVEIIRSTDEDTNQRVWDLKRVALLGTIASVIVTLAIFSIWNIFYDRDVPLPGVGTKQVVDPPRPLADFSLTDQTGQPMRLSDLHGKPTLLFFGFTHCHDVCPTTLGEFRCIKEQLKDRGDDVAFVFVSVDGSRDTPEVIAPYVGRFDPSFIGLTGDEDDVRSFGDDFHLFFQRVDLETSAHAGGDYSVDHSTYTYLIDAGGKLRVIYPFRASPAMMIDDLSSLLS